MTLLESSTDRARAKPRSYRQICGVARALDVVGERWTLLIVRDLLVGPRRYKDLMASLCGITTNLLAKRLRGMEEQGLIARVELRAPASGAAYALTQRGLDLEPVVMALGRWGETLVAEPREGDRPNLRWGLLSLKRRYRGGRDLTIELRPGSCLYQLRMSEHALDIQDTVQRAPDLILTGHDPAFFRLLLFRESAGELLKTGALSLEGPRALWRQFLTGLRLRA